MEEHKEIKISVYTEDGVYRKKYSVYEEVTLSSNCNTLKNLIDETKKELKSTEINRIRASITMELPI